MSDGTTVLHPLMPPGWAPGKRPSGFGGVWDRIGSSDPAVAYDSVWTLSTAYEKAIGDIQAELAKLLERLRKQPERIGDLIEKLDSRDFLVRERASHELERIGGPAEAALRKALAASASEEVRSRIKELLPKLEPWVVRDPDLLRALRAIWVLERIGTKDARDVLEKLAQGQPEARVTQDAKAALQRLEKRPRP
jgi:HEAT repeat protein